MATVIAGAVEEAALSSSLLLSTNNGDSKSAAAMNGEGQSSPDLDPEMTASLTRDENSISTSSNVRLGTISSARFNILSTMVGGGSLSLPMAFQKSGNGFLGPLLLLLMALLTKACFSLHVQSARLLSPVSPNERHTGRDSFESIASAAWGPRMLTASMILVTLMCFFGTVGYAVLLRDMLQPITDLIWRTNQTGPTWPNNLSMATVALLTTPLCTLQNLTSLQRFGAASMFSVLILGSCIVYRSIECHLGTLPHHNSQYTWPSFRFFPDSWKDVLDAFPLFVSCFVCHYNLAPVHNELRQPSPTRVDWWLASTTLAAFLFYLTVGLAGSAYGHCTPTGTIHGNVLLDFDESDPLLLVGRLCLAVTITLAFPMLTIPARDIVLRAGWTRFRTTVVRTGSVQGPLEHLCLDSSESGHDDDNNNTNEIMLDDDAANLVSLRAPLLENEPGSGWLDPRDMDDTIVSETGPVPLDSVGARLAAAIVVFWSAIFVAGCVESIDVVWDLLGSSLSILLSFVIPCGSYLVIAHQAETAAAAERDGNTEETNQENSVEKPSRFYKGLSWFLVIASVPLMIISTLNAIHNTFGKS